MDWFTPNLGMSNESWREGRKLLDRSLRAGATISYRQMMQEKTRWFLAQLFANPKEFRHHIELSLCCLPYIRMIVNDRADSRGNLSCRSHMVTT